MTFRASACAAGIVVGLLAAGVAAQIGGKPVSGGNPTPGTPQPDAPNLADRVTLAGCVELASGTDASAPAVAVDGNAVTDSRFQLTGAERRGDVPPDTGGSPRTAAPASRTYRLAAIESQLSPFVGTKVEISGEILPGVVGAPTTASGAAPALQVEFVQKIAPSCR